MSSVKPRAKKACTTCNRRRIRCDVMEQQPCANCVALGEKCEIGISKRGKYPRMKGRQEQQKGTAIPLSISSPAASRSFSDGYQKAVVSRRSGLAPKPSSPKRGLGDTDQQTTVFLGESSPLTCVIDEGRTRSPENVQLRGMARTRLHYPISERRDVTRIREEALNSYKEKLEKQLLQNGSFSFPPEETREALLQAYFTWFHPCFPILDRKAIHDAYEQDSLSPLLFQAMLFIGVSLCPDSALTRAGFHVRYTAKFLFYSRARAIYDADCEPDKIVKLQALFLLSFWRGGPSEDRDTRFWLEVGIGLAQKRGMHVMSKLPFQSNREEKLWKRIWWAFYIRDQQSSSALGLPARIRDEDCDVAMLEFDDIKEEATVKKHSVFGLQTAEHVPYPIEMAKLARLCMYPSSGVNPANGAVRAIVSAQYLPTITASNELPRETLHTQLTEWESRLPAEMKLGNQSSSSAIFLTGLLHMTYNNLYILLYRPLFLNPHADSDGYGGHLALEAATRSTRIIEDMLSHNLVQHGPNHLITHIFSTLCIQTINCCRTTNTMKKLAEHRARLCLLGLQELQKSWDLENWVLELFFRCLDEGMACRLRGDPDEKDLAVVDSGDMDQDDAARELKEPPAESMPQESLQDIHNPQDISASNDWYSLLNFTDDYTDVLGSSPYPDSLNLQNLESLYRFL